MKSVAYFISPHGFGHASRAAAVMAAAQAVDPAVQFEIFTLVPEWLFRISLSGSFTYHPLLTDIGLVQKNPLEEDLAGTIEKLKALLPFDPTLVSELAGQVKRLGCSLVVCDIPAMGIAVARAAGIPCLLMENFRWDWIYRGYLLAEPRFQTYITYLEETYSLADYLIQAEPICQPDSRADLVTVPISREPRLPAGLVRQELGIPLDTKMILVAMGGGHDHRRLPEIFPVNETYTFVFMGSSHSVQRQVNRVLLPNEHYSPDLVRACDAVVGKAGYSTVAETYHARVPFAYLARSKFIETQVLGHFIENQIGGFKIHDLGDWLSWLPCLEGFLLQPGDRIPRPNGSGQAARFLLNLL